MDIYEICRSQDMTGPAPEGMVFAFRSVYVEKEMSEPLAVVAARNAMEEARQRLDFAQRDYEYAKQRYLDEVSRPSDGQLLTEGRVR